MRQMRLIPVLCFMAGCGLSGVSGPGRSGDNGPAGHHDHADGHWRDDHDSG